MKKLIIFSLIMLCILLYSCELSNFAPSGSLHPPLSVTLSSSNNIIFVSFWALNNESYFSGYNIYIGTTATQVSNMTTPISNYATGSLPFYSVVENERARSFTLEISNDNSGSPLAAVEWYVGVTAYSSQNSANSVMSDISSIILVP